MTIEEMKERKKELGYTNQQLSELSGVPVGTVSKILSGATACPRYETIQALEKALRKKTSYLEKIASEKLIADKKICRVSEPTPAYGKKPGYTLEDYLRLPEDGPRKELIDGVFYDMGEPTTVHQAIVAFLMNKFMIHIAENQGTCFPVISPVAVQLDSDDKTVVEPDIMVVCDRSKFKNGRILGAPDLVIEVLSPSTRKKDMGIKAYKYQNAGVREYWLVDPKAEKVLVYDYENDGFPTVYGFEDIISVRIWNGDCRINLKDMRDYISFLKE